MYVVPDLTDNSDEALENAIESLEDALKSELDAIETTEHAEAYRIRWAGRKSGALKQVQEKWLDAAPRELKRRRGMAVNEVKATIEVFVQKAKHRAQDQAIFRGIRLDDSDIARAKEKFLLRDRVDITLPGIRRPLGAEHPVIRTMNEMVAIFKRMGYSVGVGPEIETDYYNFESLNFPPNHPARDTQDTIFVAGQEQKEQRDRMLLRTHTSPVQIRTMEKQKPPVRIVIPGKVHRNDAADATHSPVFHQIEGLCVGTNITFSDLKGTLDHAMKAFFGSNVKTRFFPSFFPFTEPSADVAISCFKCGGTGRLADGPCRLCKTSGWVELLGSGMVDPNVYGFVGYDPQKVSGFAFGMGVERLAMALYDIDDIQLLFQGDVRFLEQFA